MAMKSLGLGSNPYGKLDSSSGKLDGRQGLAVSDSATANTAQAGAGLRCESLRDGETTPETAPPHLITSSVRRRIDSGIVMLSALVVLRLTTSSNLVGCSIGRSPGLAPFSILSTNRADRRNRSP